MTYLKGRKYCDVDFDYIQLSTLQLLKKFTKIQM